MRRNKRVGIIKGNLVILLVKYEPQVLFGAGEFSPLYAYISGLKSRAPTDMHPSDCLENVAQNAIVGSM